jgi:hypothetical protein
MRNERHRNAKNAQPTEPQRTNTVNKYTNYPRAINTTKKKYNY